LQAFICRTHSIFLAREERRMAAERGGKAPEGDVVLSHVVFGYDGRIVLNDISFTVKQGEQVTLVGRTGAGKSTIFKLLLGLYKPNSGTITIGGRDAADIAETEARVLDALRRASAGRTVLSISHRVYESLGGRIIQVQAAS
jgi:ABC-type multidrug transport system fused ATPase/permease subunit